MELEKKTKTIRVVAQWRMWGAWIGLTTGLVVGVWYAQPFQVVAFAFSPVVVTFFLALIVLVFIAIGTLAGGGGGKVLAKSFYNRAEDADEATMSEEEASPAQQEEDGIWSRFQNRVPWGARAAFGVGAALVLALAFAVDANIAPLVGGRISISAIVGGGVGVLLWFLIHLAMAPPEDSLQESHRKRTLFRNGITFVFGAVLMVVIALVMFLPLVDLTPGMLVGMASVGGVFSVLGRRLIRLIFMD